MIKTKIFGLTLAAGMLMTSNVSIAGNEDRAGSAGAQQLLINPWARSSGWADAGVSSVRGLEAVYTNVAGLAFTSKTELMFARTNWLSGSGININNIGFSQRVGETSVIALSVMAMNFGDIPVTTVSNPEGTNATFSPSTFNLGLSFAKEFSNSIYGGMTVRAISERISDISASGIAFDAGIRYITGENDQVKFGIALKNVGPPMTYSGDGLSYTINQEFLGIDATYSVDQRGAKFELPSLVNLGASYDFILSEDHLLTMAAAFTSNSFTKDQIRLGANYNFDAKKAMFRARAGYVYEKGIFKGETRTTALTGLTGGFSVDFQFGEDESKSMIGIDYSYRTSDYFNGVHSIGVRVSLD